MKRKIVIITDCSDIASSEIRGAILSNLASSADVEIEPVVPVKPFSILNGNFVLRLMAESYPEGTIFLVILNPMKIRPARLIGRTKLKNFTFIGANTGAFTWFLKDFGLEELYELNDPGFLPFGGKYVHSPAVAEVASGKSLSLLGGAFSKEMLLNVKVEEGSIIHIDNFGLMKFVGNINGLDEGDKLEVKIGEKTISAVYAKRMMSLETGEWVIYPGSSFDLPELGKVRENGAEVLNAKIGDQITFTKRPS